MSGLVLNKNKKALHDEVDVIFATFCHHMFCQPVLTGKNQWLITHFLPPPANPAGQRPQPVEVSECNKELHANIYSKKYS